MLPYDPQASVLDWAENGGHSVLYPNEENEITQAEELRPRVLAQKMADAPRRVAKGTRGFSERKRPGLQSGEFASTLYDKRQS